MAATAGLQVPITARIYSHRALSLTAICFLISGATGLIYEVLWARMLGLIFGATTLGISAVLTAFMGGLALGSLLAAKFAPRFVRPLRAYASIEALIGLYALIVPLLFRWIDLAYAGVWQQMHPGFYAFALARFALATVVLIVPTTLMGATLPLIATAVERSSGQGPNVIATFYTYNLGGAIAGTVAAGFFLLPTFGVRTTIGVTAAINLLIGAAAFLIDAKARGPEKVAVVNGQFDKLSRQSGDGPILEGVRFWFICAFVSGFVTIGMQVVWSRLLAMIIGSSTYAFSVVLALFLAGLALGAYAVSKRKYQDTKSLRRSIVLMEFLTTISLFVSVRVTNATPALLVDAGFRLGVDSWTGLLALQIATATVLILLPAILMGTIMPLVLMWAGNSIRQNGRELALFSPQTRVRLVGHSLALNTAGAIAGSVVTAFLLIPGTNTPFTIFCVSSLCLLVAGIAYEPRPRVDPALGRSLAIGGVMVLITTMFVLWPPLNLNALSSGAYDSFVRVLAKARSGVPEDVQNDRPSDHQLLMYDEGRTATVSVRRDWGITSVAINGRTNASDGDDMPTQIMLGQLGILFAPRLDRALIVGFATGVTAGSVLQSPVSTLACVEIEPAAIASSHFFEHVNNQPQSDPRLCLIVDDARTYLRVNPAKYDLIVSEPSHPWVPGVANLFTREFFALSRERLQDDGLFVQWLQIYQLSTESLRSVLATFHQVFPNVALFRVQGAANGKDLIILGSRRPLFLARMNERFKDTRVAREIMRAGINSPSDLQAWFICDETQLGPAVAGAVINTDDNMHVETVAPREAFRPTMEENAAWIESLRRESFPTSR